MSQVLLGLLGFILFSLAIFRYSFPTWRIRRLLIENPRFAGTLVDSNVVTFYTAEQIARNIVIARNIDKRRDIVCLMRSCKKNRRIKQIMKRLGAVSRRFDGSKLSLEMVKFIMGQAISSERRDTEDELYELVLNDPDLRLIMKKYSATLSTLRDVYLMLCACGAGQWARGNYVPVAAITTTETLDFILHTLNAESGLSEHDKALRIAYDLLQYFKAGKNAVLKRS